MTIVKQRNDEFSHMSYYAINSKVIEKSIFVFDYLYFFNEQV